MNVRDYLATRRAEVEATLASNLPADEGPGAFVWQADHAVVPIRLTAPASASFFNNILQSPYCSSLGCNLQDCTRLPPEFSPVGLPQPALTRLPEALSKT